MHLSQADAIEVVKVYIKDHFAKFDSAGLSLIANDIGKTWEVYYELKSDQLGGSPMVYVSKDNGNVVKSYMTQ